MVHDYRLYELNDVEFEGVVVRISVRWLGQGVTGFSEGPDGGRDGKFEGTAQSFPSSAAPLQGKCVLQAKHVSAPNKSCSDREFQRLLKKEHPKIKSLIKKGLCDHYIVFTNRKLPGGADEKLISELMDLGLKSAHIIGTERLALALDDFKDIAEQLPNVLDTIPFRFDPADLVEVIKALHKYADTKSEADAFDSAHDFEKIKIKDQKNKINGLTEEYYQQLIVNGSMPFFAKIENFLKNPRNTDLASLYHDTADELKEKILVNKSKFLNFDGVFAFLSEQVQSQRADLKYKRRLVRTMLHYMYCNCDIGSKDQQLASVSPHANPA